MYSVSLSMAAFDIGPNLDKGKFGNSGENKVQVIVDDGGANLYGVTITDASLKGQDLFLRVRQHSRRTKRLWHGARHQDCPTQHERDRTPVG